MSAPHAYIRADDTRPPAERWTVLLCQRATVASAHPTLAEAQAALERLLRDGEPVH